MKPSSRTTIVTGAAGFIGSHVCEALLRIGHDVVGVDNFDEYYEPDMKRSNIAGLRSHPRFTLLEGDVRDASLLADYIGPNTLAIIHLAARAGVRPSIDEAELYLDVNAGGTLKLLEVCRAYPSCRFVLGSSSSVYGNSPSRPFRESDPAAQPISPYAASKRAAELLCYTYHHLFGIPVTCLRFFTVYGPRQRPDLAIHRFVRRIETGEPIPVFGDGSMRRDYTYIDDIVDGIVRAAERCEGYAVYNLGSSNPVALADLIVMIEQTLGKRAKIVRRDPPPGDVECTFADITKAQRELGYRPVTPLRTGLGRFVHWFRRASGILTKREAPAGTRHRVRGTTPHHAGIL